MATVLLPFTSVSAVRNLNSVTFLLLSLKNI